MYHFYDEPPAQITVFQNAVSKTNQQTQTVRYECTKCDSIFSTRLYLHHHEATAHNRIFHCPFCPSLFSNKPDYATHVNTHTEKKLLPCAYCKKVFLDVREYTVHVKLHTKSAMYKCDKCSAMFPQLSKLRTHSAIHVNRKFVHTIPKSSKQRIVCPCKSPSEDSGNQAESNGSTTEVSTSCQTEASTHVSEPEDSQPNSLGEPEAGCSRPLESKENSSKRRSSSSNRKRKKKAKEERLKKMKHMNSLKPVAVGRCQPSPENPAAKESAEIACQTLSLDDIPLSSRINHVSSTSGHERVIRKRGLRSENERAAERITDHREFSEDETEATLPQIPSNPVLENIVHEQGPILEQSQKRRGRPLTVRNESNRFANVLRDRFQKILNVGSVNENEAGISSEGNMEETSAQRKRNVSSTRETFCSTDQENNAEISATKTQVLSESKKIVRKRGRPFKKRCVRVIETEAGGLSENNIISEPETQTSSSTEEIRHTQDQEGNAEITSAAREKVPSQSENKNTKRKRGRPFKTKTGTIVETESSRLFANHLEPNSTSVQPITSLQEILTNPDERRDEVEPLSTLTDINAVHETDRSLPSQGEEAPQQASEINSSQPSNAEKISLVDKSIPFIDLTSSPEPSEPVVVEKLIEDGEVAYSNRRNIVSAKILEKVQKPNSLPSNVTGIQKGSAPKVSVVRNVTGSLPRTQFRSNVPIPKITVLRRPETSSSNIPVYKSFETIESSTKDAPLTSDSVYTFQEENLNRRTATTNAENSVANKRHHNELWRFFTPSPTKKAKRKRRKSVHFYQCSNCPRGFPNTEVLGKHQLMHSQNRGVTCNLCGGVFGALGNLINHKKLTHGPPF